MLQLSNLLIHMALAISNMDGCGLSDKAQHERLKERMGSYTVKVINLMVSSNIVTVYLFSYLKCQYAFCIAR